MQILWFWRFDESPSVYTRTNTYKEHVFEHSSGLLIRCLAWFPQKILLTFVFPPAAPCGTCLKNFWPAVHMWNKGFKDGFQCDFCTHKSLQKEWEASWLSSEQVKTHCRENILRLEQPNWISGKLRRLKGRLVSHISTYLTFC